MPEGLEKGLIGPDFADLIAFVRTIRTTHPRGRGLSGEDAPAHTKRSTRPIRADRRSRAGRPASYNHCAGDSGTLGCRGQDLGAERQVVADDVDDLVVVEIRGPHLAFGVLLLLELLLGLLLGGLFLGIFRNVFGPELRLVERDRMPGLALDELLDLLVELLELGVGLPALDRALLEGATRSAGTR